MGAVLPTVQSFYFSPNSLEGSLKNLPGPLCGHAVFYGQVFISPFVKEAVNKNPGLLQVGLETGKRGLRFRGKGRVYRFLVFIRNPG
jgi:hypothetical protein